MKYMTIEMMYGMLEIRILRKIETTSKINIILKNIEINKNDDKSMFSH